MQRGGSGEIVGLVGENGSGKSALLKVLVGDIAADAGTVERTESFGYCPQVPVLYERLTVGEHLELFGAASTQPAVPWRRELTAHAHCAKRVSSTNRRRRRRR